MSEEPFNLTMDDDGNPLKATLADGTEITGDALDTFMQDVVEPRVEEIRQALQRRQAQNSMRKTTLEGMIGTDQADLQELLLRLQIFRQYLLPEPGSVARMQYDLHEETVLGNQLDEAVATLTSNVLHLPGRNHDGR